MAVRHEDRPYLTIFIVCFALVGLTVLAYWQVQHLGFIHFDDPAYVTNNAVVRAGLTTEGIIHAFTDTHTGIWHPLTWLSHMLDCELFGLNPKAHHLTNLLFHMLNSLLLFLLLRTLTQTLWRSALVAALFALHPLHVESVVWISERKDVLSCLFWLLTLWAYVSYVRQRGLTRYMICVALFALGLMAKPMLVTLPFIMLLLDYWPLKRYGHFLTIPEKSSQDLSRRGRVSSLRTFFHLFTEKTAFLVLALGSAFVAFFTQERAGAMVSMEKLDLWSRISNALLSYVSYMGKMLWPRDLAVIYPLRNEIATWQTSAAIGLLCLLTLVSLRYARTKPYLPVGWFWYLITLLPVIGLVKLGMQSMADRYTYIPFIGLFIAIIWWIHEMVGHRRHARIIAIGGAIASVASLMLCTARQVPYWRDSVTLFQHAVEATKDNYMAHKFLGNALAEKGRHPEAMAHLKTALRLYPDFAGAHNDLAVVLVAKGRLDEAVSHLHEALRIEPSYGRAHYNLAYTLAQQKRITEAAYHYSEAIRLDPKDAKAHGNLGLLLEQQGKLDQAIDHYSEAVRIDPGDAIARHNLRRALQKMGSGLAL